MAYVRSATFIPQLLTIRRDYISGNVWGVKRNRQSGRRRTGVGTEMKPEMQKFKSGATSSGKLPPYDLITLNFQDRTAKRLELGAEKHGRFNYRKGLKDKEFIMDRLNHAFKHLKLAMDQIESGEKVEDDDLAAVSVNVMMAMEYQHTNDLI
jgi:hypothetical protein